jgi:hypothetical protein
MLVVLDHAIIYVTSLGAILIMFASVIGEVCWLCITVFRALAHRLR